MVTLFMDDPFHHTHVTKSKDLNLLMYITKMPSLTDKFFLGKNINLKKSWGFLKSSLKSPKRVIA